MTTDDLFDFPIPEGCPDDTIGAIAWTVIHVVVCICEDTGIDPQSPEARQMAMNLIGRLMWGAA